MTTPTHAVAPPARTTRRRFALAAGALLLVVACSSTTTTSSPGTTAAPTAGSSTPGGTTVAGSPCGWPTKADKATQNVAYPDTAATYWGTSYVLAPGEKLELRGRYPDARYASFITYGPSGGSIGVLTDRDIQPDPGSTNPFQGGGPSGGRYSVTVTGSDQAAANTITAAATKGTSGGSGTSTPAGSQPGTTAAPVKVDRAVMLGTGTAGAPGVVGGTILYRVYLSNTPGDPAGGAGLPDISVVHADGSKTDVATCANPGANPAATAIIDANGPATNTPAPEQPVFIRPKAGSANLYPNPDNVYVVTILHHTPGKVVVVRGKAPTFPNTATGAAITGTEQVRYWSLCTDEYRKPYPVSFCVPDQDVAVAADGTYTFVVSTAADRPANATAANGVTWLDWGDTSVDNLLLLRHMLAAPGFAESAINLAPGALASSTMGPYTPVGVYCDASAFASGGPAACPSP
jgi:hypothetical protein